MTDYAQAYDAGGPIQKNEPAPDGAAGSDGILLREMRRGTAVPAGAIIPLRCSWPTGKQILELGGILGHAQKLDNPEGIGAFEGIRIAPGRAGVSDSVYQKHGDIAIL